jgi:hypothetical protein
MTSFNAILGLEAIKYLRSEIHVLFHKNYSEDEIKKISFFRIIIISIRTHKQ